MAAEHGIFFTFTFPRNFTGKERLFSPSPSFIIWTLASCLSWSSVAQEWGGRQAGLRNSPAPLQWTSSNQVQDSLTSKGVSVLSFF